MYFLIVWLLLPFVYGSVVVQIHRLAIYNPSSSYAFLRNVSFSMNALLESCVWECVYESHCQTAVYYSNEKVCSLFIESCQPYRIHSSGNIQASVICYPKNEIITTIATSMKTTTISPCGTPVDIGNSSTIYSVTSGSNSYTCRYVAWTVSTTGNVTLVFQFRHLPGIWYMDDVSVSDGTTELLLNGGFESGTLSPGWTRRTPNGQCTGTSAGVNTSNCRNGTYCFRDGCDNVADEISQSFPVTAGQIYYISFWLKQGGGSGPDISVNVTLS